MKEFSFSEFAPITAKILALRCEKQFFDEIDGGESGKKCGILLDSSCFYAEQGGQMCDNGYMNKEGDEVHMTTSEHFPLNRQKMFAHDVLTENHCHILDVFACR